MYQMVVTTLDAIHRISFGEDKVKAEAELARLVSLLGRDPWGSNGKGENPTHTVKSPAGDFVVVLDKAYTARIIDTDVENQLCKDAEDKQWARRLEMELSFRRGLEAAGFKVEGRKAEGE